MTLLRPFPSSLPSLAHPSDSLVPTHVPLHTLPRVTFLSRSFTSSSPPPVIISRSLFIPPSLVEHLFRRKRDSAITTKYLRGSAVTNAEGALHSFATALVPAVQCADYAWRGGHSAVPLGSTSDGKYRLGRRVVVSTSLHNDFENEEVAVRFFEVETAEVRGRDLLAAGGGGGGFRVASDKEKSDDRLRQTYDHSLKEHAVFHLLPSRRLPARSSLPHSPWSFAEVTTYISSYLSQTTITTPTTLLRDRFVRLETTHHILSLEMLFQAHLESLINELSALESLCPVSNDGSNGGYAYTFDPPSIFARHFPAELSTLLMLLALGAIVLSYQPSSSALPSMRLFALNAFTPALLPLLPLLRRILPSHILVLSRSELFPPPTLTLASSERIPQLRGATLVIHNNSDAFGQNIESESAGGSVDGVIGAWGEAARGLRRDREDLMRWVA